MSKHTPGPWVRDKYGNLKTESGESVGFRGVTIVCSGNDDRVEVAEANTDLSAAAPDLLDALIEARQVISAALMNGAPDWFKTDADVCGHHTIKKIDAAIARARGEA